MAINYENFKDGGVKYLLDKLKTKLDTLLNNKVSKTGDSMTGVLNTNSDIKFTAKIKGLYGLDSTSFSYPYMRDNGSNFWIGAEKTAGQHHRGGTYISSGYNGTKGYDTIYISVPNATNNNATNYGVYHTGNKPSKSDVGLGSVDNTSDLNKPISTATQEALDLKADLSSIPTATSELTNDSGFITDEALEDYVLKAGDTMTGELIFEASKNVGSYGNYFTATRTDTDINVGMGIGSGGVNHGVYSITQKKWIAYATRTATYAGAINTTSQATALTSLGLDVKEYGNADFSYEEGFSAYSTVANNSQEPRASKFGRVVNLTGAYKTTVARDSTAAFTLGKVPNGCEPLHDVRLRQQGTGQNSYLLVIDTNGNLKGERYGVGTNTAVPNGVWLNINATYISKS